MRLTASRQSPKDTPGPRNPRQLKRRPITNNLYPEILLYCEHNSTEPEKCGRNGQYAASQSGAVRAPQNTQHLTKTHPRRMTNNETRPRNGGRQNGWPCPPTNCQYVPTHNTHTVMQCRKPEANFPGERNTGKRLEGENVPDNSKRKTLPEDHPPPNLAIIGTPLGRHGAEIRNGA